MPPPAAGPSVADGEAVAVAPGGTACPAEARLPRPCRTAAGTEILGGKRRTAGREPRASEARGRPCSGLVCKIPAKSGASRPRGPPLSAEGRPRPGAPRQGLRATRAQPRPSRTLRRRRLSRPARPAAPSRPAAPEQALPAGPVRASPPRAGRQSGRSGPPGARGAAGHREAERAKGERERRRT